MSRGAWGARGRGAVGAGGSGRGWDSFPDSGWSGRCCGPAAILDFTLHFSLELFLVINFWGGRGRVGRRGPPSAEAGRGALTRPEEERAAPGGELGSGPARAAAAAAAVGWGRAAARGPPACSGPGPRAGAGGGRGRGAAAGARGLQWAPPPEGSGSGRRAAPGRSAAARGEQPRRSRLGDSVFPLLQWAAVNGLAQSAPSAALDFGLFLFGLELQLGSAPLRGPAPG